MMAYQIEFIAKLNDQVSGKLRGIGDVARSSLGNLKDSFSSIGKVATGDLNGIADAVTSLAAPLGIVGAGLGTVAGVAVGAAINLQQVALGFDVLSQKTGASVEFLSGFTQAADDLRVSSETVNTSLIKFSKNLYDTKGAGADVEFELMAVADAFRNMADGPEKTALAMEKFGRSGADMIPILNQGGDAIRGMMQNAKDMGLVIDGSMVESSKRMAEAVDNLGDSFEGLKNKIGAVALPVLTDAVNTATNSFSTLQAQLAIADGWIKMQTGAQMTAGELVNLKNAIDVYNSSMRGSSSMTDGMVDAMAGVGGGASIMGEAMIVASSDAIRAAENTRVAMAMLASAQGAIAVASAKAIKGTQDVLSAAYDTQRKIYEQKAKALQMGKQDIEDMRARRESQISVTASTEAANEVLDKQMGLLKGVGGSAGGAAKEVNALKDAQEELKKSQQQVGGELGASLTAMDELQRVQTAYALATGQLSAEQFAQQQAVKAVMQAVKDKAVSEEQAVATALSLAEGIASTKDAYDIAGPSGQRFADEQGKVQAAADRAGAKVRDMGQAIKNLPANTVLDVTATVKGMDQLKDVKRELLDLHERHSTVYVDVVYRTTGTPPPGSRSTGGGGGSNSGGGRISGEYDGSGASGIDNARAGNAYKIGEQGPEWFVPDQNGAVVPDYRMKGQSVSTPIVINLDGRTIAQVVAKHLR